MPVDPIGSSQLVSELRQRVRTVDLLVLAAVPIVLVGVFLTPTALRRRFLFEYTDPALPAAFISALVHLDGTHLLVNVVTYGLVVPVVFVLELLGGNRARFYRTFLVFVTLVPLVLSYSNLAAPRPAVGYGFSGVVMAFAGYLPFALAAFAETRLEIGSKSSLAPVLFFPTLGLVCVLSLRPVILRNTTVLVGAGGLVVVTLLSTLLFAVSAYEGGAVSRHRLSRALSLGGYCDLALVGLVLVATLPFVAFPAEPGSLEGTANLYVHLFGYALGFTAIYSYSEIQSRHSPEASGTGAHSH
ncbi:MAG: hypothetical protein ACI9CA_001804 [Natronomonas sp.]|jgi:hypothetical protein